MVKKRKERTLGEKLNNRSVSMGLGVAVIIFSMVVFFPFFAVSADEVPDDVILVIEKKAVAQFPYDRNSQGRVMESQENAYIAVKNYTNEGISADTLRKIKERAAFECPTNYCAQKYLVETQVKNCSYLKNYSPEDVPTRILKRMIQNAKEEFPDDYSAQKMVVAEKVEKYLDYDRVTRLEYCERELNASLDEMEELLLFLQEKYALLTHELEETKQLASKKEEILRERALRADMPREEIQRVDENMFQGFAAATRYHIVKKGENLYRISLRYGLSLNRLCKMNGITPEHTIWPGQRIVIALSL